MTRATVTSLQHDTVTLRIERRRPDEQPRWEEFEVPWTAGMTLLDAVLWVQTHIDPNLAVSYSCITNNSCKLCQARVDDKVMYLCAELVSRDAYDISPVKGDDVVADLVTERREIW